MNDDLIAALEWAVGQAQGCQADAATLRGLITDLHAGKLVRRKDIIMQLLDRAALYDKIDDGLSGYDKMAQGLREFAEELEAE